jgi:hypothetical protein
LDTVRWAPGSCLTNGAAPMSGVVQGGAVQGAQRTVSNATNLTLSDAGVAHIKWEYGGSSAAPQGAHAPGSVSCAPCLGSRPLAIGLKRITLQLASMLHLGQSIPAVCGLDLEPSCDGNAGPGSDPGSAGRSSGGAAVVPELGSGGMRSGSAGSGQLGAQQVPASALLAGALMPSPYPAGTMLLPLLLVMCCWVVRQQLQMDCNSHEISCSAVCCPDGDDNTVCWTYKH